jgi:hypothetical protein
MIRLINKNWLSAFVGACVMLALAIDTQAQTLNTVWERSAKTGAEAGLPSWYTVGSIRGMDLNGDSLYAADRANSEIRVMDAATGADITLTTPYDLTGVAGGTYAMNDLAFSDDGVLFLGNLTVNASDTAIVNPNPFRLYWWTTEGGTYADSLTFYTSEGHRIGDKITVVGSVADNTVEVWMPAAGTDPGVIYVATTANQGTDWAIETITLSGDQNVIGSNSDVVPFDIGRTSDFYVGGNSSAPSRYDNTGAYITGSQLPSSSRNGMDIFEANGNTYLSVYTYRPEGAGSGAKTGRISIFDVTTADSPTLTYQTSLLGDDTDTFSSIYGEGKVSVNADGSFNLYTLEGVNGLAAFNNKVVDDPSNLIFSEYIEGSSNNKAIEITNLSDSTVNLQNYRVAQSVNGGGWEYYHVFSANASIAAGEPYVLLNSQVDPLLFAAEDGDEVLAYPSAVHHNGDDARAIIHIDSETGDTTLVDVFGQPDNDPGSGWDVAGVDNGTQNHTLLRKGSVTTGNTTPLGSFGTDAATSEWYVLDQNDFSNLGKVTDSATVDVTFTVNMSTVQDTISSNYDVSINGYFKSNGNQTFASGETTTWDTGASAQLTNVGGDYWQGTFKMAIGDTLHYKYRYNLEGVSGRDEAGILPASVNNPDGNDLRFVIANSSTKLPVEYFNTTGNATLADLNPFVEKADSIGVLFRVNVGAQVQDGTFDPENHTVSVRGSVSPLDWSASTLDLVAEPVGEGSDNYFYSAVGYFDKTQLDTVNTSYTIRHKFFLNNGTGDGGYESSSDRDITIATLQDTTLQYKFFSNNRPTDAVIVNTTLSFEVNVGILEGLGLFNSSIDTVSVRGTFNGWGEDRMNFNQVLGTYEANNLPYTKAEGTVEKYKYYIKWDASRDSSDSPNYLADIEAANSGWEEPGITGGADRTFTIQNTPNQTKISEFYNGVEPEALLTSTNVDGGAATVTFSIDMTPATSAATNSKTLFNPASDSVFLFVDTPFFALTNKILVPGDNGQNFITNPQSEIDRLMFTDDNGDMIYELELPLTLPTLNHIGFRIAYGEPTSADGQIVPNGGGFDAGRRHYQYIQPQVDAQGNVTWPSTFTFPQLTWKESDLPFETPPDYQTVGIEDVDGTVDEFRLNQNYPNPFNPSTTISFNLPNAADVTLTVYNVLGQRVATLLNNKKYTSGSHTLSFDASNLASGVYIYRLEAGSFTSLKRMTLIK